VIFVCVSCDIKPLNQIDEVWNVIVFVVVVVRNVTSSRVQMSDCIQSQGLCSWYVLLWCSTSRDVQNPMSDCQFSKNWTEKKTKLTSKSKNQKLTFHGSVFKKTDWQFGDSFSRLIHRSSSNMIESTLKVFIVLYTISLHFLFWITLAVN